MRALLILYLHQNDSQVCGYSFHTRAKLQRHMKSHSGVRDYEVSYCAFSGRCEFNFLTDENNLNFMQWFVREKFKFLKTVKYLNICKFCLLITNYSNHIVRYMPQKIPLFLQRKRSHQTCALEREEKSWWVIEDLQCLFKEISKDSLFNK